MKPRKLRAELARLQKLVPVLEQRSQAAATRSEGARGTYREAKAAYKAARKAHRSARKAARDLSSQLRLATRRLTRLRRKAEAEDKERKPSGKAAPKAKSRGTKR